MSGNAYDGRREDKAEMNRAAGADGTTVDSGLWQYREDAATKVGPAEWSKTQRALMEKDMLELLLH